MPWQLDIHLLDVGQGDCTLIIAENVALGQRRTMLIDAGESAYGEIADDKVLALGLPGVDHIVSTHYDKDHRAGLQALLLADDLADLVETLTTAANANAFGAHRRARIASVDAAVCAAALGNYGPNLMFANAAAMNARNGTAAAGTDNAAADNGVWYADQVGSPIGVASLIPYQYTRKRVAKNAGIAAANAIAAGQAGAVLTTTIRDEIFWTLRTGMADQGARFWTDNRYNATHVIDLGPAAVPTGWVGAINGQYTVSGHGVVAPHVNRVRTSVPNLGDEVLWNSGPNAMLPPANAPEVYVVSCDGWAWQGNGVAPFMITTAASGNNCSIGLLIRFNSFFYCTLGDMATVGENPLMTAVMANGLPNPAGGGLLPVPPRMASFKCSHHGSASSTSNAFLASANPRSALVSSGFNASYQHPDDALVFRLHTRASIGAFYLTNCNFQSHVVAASMGLNQLNTAGNKSRVAGDNNNVNLAPGRNRGDIRLRITQAQSQAVAGAGRQYGVRYWEDDLAPAAGFRNVALTF
jgi:beta-lactamase superfamily II metal-dependent hydrolase